jgi:hypothetical protein
MTPPRIDWQVDVRANPQPGMSFLLNDAPGLVTLVGDGVVHYDWRISDDMTARRSMPLGQWRYVMYDEPQHYTSRLDDYTADGDVYEVGVLDVLLVLWDGEAGVGYLVREARWLDVDADVLRAMGVEP